MALLINLALVVLGILILVFAGDWLVRGAAALARKLGIPALIVGLTIVAFGTSAPELVVSIQAVLSGAGDLALGNVVGSNIANILLVLGLPALVLPIVTNIAGVGRNGVVTVAATILMIVLLFLHQPLERWQGALLFALIIIYLVWMFRLARSGSSDPALQELTDIDELEEMPKNMLKIAMFLVVGLIGLPLGGHLIVENSSAIAVDLGVSKEIIGLTIVAFGTSLPELSTVIVAALRNQSDVAIGNILGSNIFNIFAVLGAAALTGPVPVSHKMLVFDVWVMLVSILALAAFIFTRQPIGPRSGAILFVGYCLYIAALARSVMV